MRKVVILQEYVPQYRVPFFDLLYERAKSYDVDLRVGFGDVSASQASRNDSSPLKCGIHIDQKEWRLAGRRVVLRRTSEAIRGADLVILEQARRNIDAYRLLAAKRSSDPLVALWGHGRDYTRQASSLEQGLSRWLTSKADWFFAYTTGAMETVVAQGFAPENVTVVQNSIDTAGLRAGVGAVGHRSVQLFMELHDLHGKTALFIGALDSSKRLSFLEEASRLAHNVDSKFRLLIAGEGELRSEVEDWAGRDSWISYLGPLSGHEKALAMASSQILTVPGRVGLVAVDSFAAGLPIITTKWPWHAPEFEYLEDGRNALVTANETADYAASLIDILNDRPQLLRLQAAASEDAERYTVQGMAERFLTGILSALDARST